MTKISGGRETGIGPSHYIKLGVVLQLRGIGLHVRDAISFCKVEGTIDNNSYEWLLSQRMRLNDGSKLL